MNVISLQLDSSSLAARFRACRVLQARRDVSDLERLRISLVLTNRKSTVTNTRLGPAKVPKPGVDLIHMAAPALSLARAVSTPEKKLLLQHHDIQGRSSVMALQSTD